MSGRGASQRRRPAAARSAPALALFVPGPVASACRPASGRRPPFLLLGRSPRQEAPLAAWEARVTPPPGPLGRRSVSADSAQCSESVTVPSCKRGPPLASLARGIRTHKHKHKHTVHSPLAFRHTHTHCTFAACSRLLVACQHCSGPGDRLTPTWADSDVGCQGRGQHCQDSGLGSGIRGPETFKLTPGPGYCDGPARVTTAHHDTST